MNELEGTAKEKSIYNISLFSSHLAFNHMATDNNYLHAATYCHCLQQHLFRSLTSLKVEVIAYNLAATEHVIMMSVPSGCKLKSCSFPGGRGLLVDVHQWQVWVLGIWEGLLLYFSLLFQMTCFDIAGWIWLHIRHGDTCWEQCEVVRIACGCVDVWVGVYVCMSCVVYFSPWLTRKKPPIIF